MRLTRAEREISWLTLGYSKSCIKTDGDKLFKDLLTKKIFSKKGLSGNFKIKLYLNRGLLWEILGCKLITAFFCKTTIR